MHGAGWDRVSRRAWWARAGAGLVAVAVTSACSAPFDFNRDEALAAETPAPAAPPSEPAVVPTATTAPPLVVDGAAVTSTGVVVPVLGTAPDGWVVGTPCGRTATVRSLRALTGTVVLDPGHGGRETGAVGPLGNKESDLNLAVASYAQRALEAAGIQAVPTRTEDYRMAITARASVVKAVKPKAVVSIHHNSVPSHTQGTPGTEIFHQGVGASAAESRRLAGLVYEEVTAVLSRLEVADWAATPRPGAKPRLNSEGDDFYGILRRTQGTPTALAELGFVSHRAEERKYSEPSVQQQVGEAVARGVVRFLTTGDPGSGFVTPPQLADDDRVSGGTANCQDPPLG